MAASTQSQPIAQTAHAFAFSAVLAAEEGPCLFEAVTNDANAAMRACRRQRMDRAFEAVKNVGFSVVNHLKHLVVIVPTGFADRHDASPIAVLPGAPVQYTSARPSPATLIWINRRRDTEDTDLDLTPNQEAPITCERLPTWLRAQQAGIADGITARPDSISGLALPKLRASASSMISQDHCCWANQIDDEDSYFCCAVGTR